MRFLRPKLSHWQTWIMGWCYIVDGLVHLVSLGHYALHPSCVLTYVRLTVRKSEQRKKSGR